MTTSNPQAGVCDPCALLPQLRAAYYALLAGEQTARVRDGDRWQDFHRGEAQLLRDEIRRLEYLCPKSPINPHGGAQGGSTSARNRVLGK